MKKIIFIILSVLSFISCGNVQTKTESSPFKKFLYKGHHYLSWDRYGQYGIVHDPDCLCHLDTLSIYIVNSNDTTYLIKKK